MTDASDTSSGDGKIIAAGLCSVTFRSRRVPEVIDIAQRAGLTHLEWGGDVHVPPGDMSVAQAVAQATTRAGLTIASYGSYLRVGHLGPGGDVEVARVLDTAAALGAPNVRVWASGERAPVELAGVCEAAATYGITVSLEYHPGTATETAAGTRALLTAVGAPNLMTYWQPDPSRPTAGQLDDLTQVSAWLSHLHVFAWDSERNRLPLEDAGALWPAAFVIGGNGPEPPAGQRVAFLEFVRDDDPAQLAADAAVLHRWLGGER